MKDAITLIVVVAVGIAVGVAVTVQMASAPMIGQQLAQVLMAQQRIDSRLTTLEDQQTKMLEIFESARKAAERVGQQAQRPPQPPARQDLNQVYDIPIGTSHVRGPKDASVTIVKFSDFQCPFCQRFYSPVLEALKAYPKDVKFVMKNFPLSFHPKAKPAAKAALAAGEQGRYWEMVDLMMADPANLEETKFFELAKKIGIDPKKFEKDLKQNDGKYEEILNKDTALGNQVGVQGTPTFFINGQQTPARDFNGFKTEIDKILKEKK